MRTPISWLKDYVSLDDSLDGLVESLTFAGIEVEEIETVGSDCPGVVVGEVTSVDPHPNADRLRLCTVQSGTGKTRVVCGAPNIELGGKYPFAPVGTTLPNGLTLKRAKIRGEISEGMLCAEDELGLSGDHDGLLVLKTNEIPGTPLSKVLGPPEVVLDLEITPNRPDCLSMIGVARELAALYRLPLTLPSSSITIEPGDPELYPQVQIDDETACPRYVVRIIDEVTPGPSPTWMQKRLILAGIRPINNLVDITNYVMLEWGQPLHAFDRSNITDGQIIVRRARQGEKLRTLDGVNRTLDSDTLLIADPKAPIAMAGIMGAAHSEIVETTRTVLLESAFFQPSLVRSTSQRLGLSTESSYRFERGVDVGMVEQAGRRAAALIEELAGGHVLDCTIDAYPKPATQGEIICRYGRVRRLLGVNISSSAIQDYLEALSLKVEKHTESACRVRIPTFRGDLTREVDLIEEVARMHGLDQIPSPAPRVQLIPDADDSAMRSVISLRKHLVGLGLREIMNYSAVSPSLLDQLTSEDPSLRVILPNPLSQDQSVLRTSLLPQMLESIARNLSRQIQRASFFEIGKAYHLDGESGHHETDRLAVGIFGHVNTSHPLGHDTVTGETLYGWIMGIWEALSEALPVASATFEAESQIPWEPGHAVKITQNGAFIGHLGLLSPKVSQEWKIHQPVGLLEVDLSPILRPLGKASTINPIAVYPAISRDIALIVDTSVTHRQIIEIAEKIVPKELETIELFDIFSGEGIGDGKKSLAYSFSYRSLERTLTDDEVNGFHKLVSDALVEGVNAEIRDH